MSENRENENVSRSTVCEVADTDHGDKRSVSAETPADSRTDRDSGESPVRESGGPKGLEPTRYGDWEKAGRCIDF